MKILIVTDAWHPQVNGVVRTLDQTSSELRGFGHEVEMLTPQEFKTYPCPSYPEIRLSRFPGRQVARRIEQFQPDSLHISTEGPLGMSARRYAVKHGLAFTTSYHTRFPEYVQERIRVPLQLTYGFLRWFHGPSAAVFTPTPAVRDDLLRWKVGNPVIWSRGVDLETFSVGSEIRKPNSRPIYLNVGRVAVEKNLEEFLKLDLDGEKWVVGDGPARKELEARYPEVVFHGAKTKEELPAFYRAADVFVFPSRTDTFGLVLLEAMACGSPVAAYPVSGPIDVIADAPAGALDDDLEAACERALQIPRTVARAHAEKFSWEAATRKFESYLVPCLARNEALVA